MAALVGVFRAFSKLLSIDFLDLDCILLCSNWCSLGFLVAVHFWLDASFLLMPGWEPQLCFDHRNDPLVVLFGFEALQVLPRARLKRR